MRRVLITGITGYIGSNLARSLLDEGVVVCGIVREPLHNEYIADIIDKIDLYYTDGSYESIKRAVENGSPDVIYHLATYYSGQRSPKIMSELLNSNIVFGASVLEAMVECGVSCFVNATSVMTCYKGKGYCPQNLYAATKQSFSDLLYYYTDAGFISAITMMLADTYGPGDKRPKILNLIRDAVVNGEHIALSDGTQDYDVVFIDDVIDALMLAGERVMDLENGQNEVFQVLSETPLSLRKTVELMIGLNGGTIDIGWGERAKSSREIRKVIRMYPPLPNWKQRVSLSDGLKRMLDR